MQYRYQVGDQVFEIALERKGEGYQAVIDGQKYDVEVLAAQSGQLTLRVAGRPVTLYTAEDGPARWISVTGCTYRLAKPTPRTVRQATETSGGESVRAPMPAQVRAVQVTPGEVVEKGQTLLLLEAMKMEIRVRAPIAGKVSRLLVSNGQAVEKEQALVELAPDEDSDGQKPSSETRKLPQASTKGD